MKREETEVVHFRFPKSLADRLRKDADTGHRNFSQEVIMRLLDSYKVADASVTSTPPTVSGVHHHEESNTNT